MIRNPRCHGWRFLNRLVNSAKVVKSHVKRYRGPHIGYGLAVGVRQSCKAAKVIAEMGGKDVPYYRIENSAVTSRAWQRTAKSPSENGGLYFDSASNTELGQCQFSS